MFEILKADDSQFYFVLRAKNGEIIAVSETYISKAMCRKGIASCRWNALTAKVKDLTCQSGK